MPVERLGNTEEIRKKLTQSRLKRIRGAYRHIYKDIQKELRKNKTRMPKQALVELQRHIEQNIKNADEEIANGIKNDMYTVCESAVEDKRNIMKKEGYKAVDIQKAYIHVPDRVVRSINNGSVYNNGWSLSKAIWGHSKSTQETLQRIISRGVAYGKGTLEIAKDLEKYVMPEEAKGSRIIEFQKYLRDSEGNLIKDKDGNQIPDGRPRKYYPGRVDYNAQRLARTMIAHAYQQAFEQVNKYDPFVKGYIWLTSGEHGRVCRICLDRDGQFFKKDELPLDHPNGMCTFEAYFEDSLDTIANMVADWYSSEPGTFPELDEYAKRFMEE